MRNLGSEWVIFAKLAGGLSTRTIHPLYEFGAGTLLSRLETRVQSFSDVTSVFQNGGKTFF